MQVLHFPLETRRGGKLEATLNIRIDAALKQRGNAVLEAAGMGPSEIVRALWEEMAETRQVPQFSVQRQREHDEKARKRALLLELASFPKTTYSDYTDEQLREEYSAQFA